MSWPLGESLDDAQLERRLFPALGHLSTTIHRNPIVTAETTDPRLRPGVAASRLLAQAIQRRSNGAIRLLAGECVDQLVYLSVTPPASLSPPVAGNTHAGVIATAPMQQQLDPVVDHGRNDLFEHCAHDALARLDRRTRMAPCLLKIGTQRSQSVLLCRRQRVRSSGCRGSEALFLAPITAAQSAHVLASRVLAMDETSIKAGREAKGKMRTGWLWPVYGDADEVVFHYAPSRAHRHVHGCLGEYRGTLLSDGYEAYAAYAGQRPGEVTHALCWSHTRRGFERANDSEPEAAAEALAMIGAMYGHEKQIRADGLTDEDKRAYRQAHTRPVVETFWRWCRAQCHRPELLPKSPLAKALNYALERRSGLEVFVDNPEVAIDTNHLHADNRFMPTPRRKPLTDRAVPLGLSA